jgi:hypothetical protein
MSNIPRARELIQQVIDHPLTHMSARGTLRYVLRLMYREEYARRAPAKRQVIDKNLRRRIKRMSRTYPTMTEHEIANAVGLRSSGRISEVLHGKR